MTDFLVVHVSHPFIMNSRTVMAQCLRFLQEGKFRHDDDGFLQQSGNTVAKDEKGEKSIVQLQSWREK